MALGMAAQNPLAELALKLLTNFRQNALMPNLI
jgi:hypothetical protein